VANWNPYLGKNLLNLLLVNAVVVVAFA